MSSATESDIALPDQNPFRIDPSDPAWMRGVQWLVRLGGIGSAILVLVMTVNVVADFTGRTFFNRPVTGTLELVQLIWMPGAAMLVLGYAQLRNEQIRVELVADEGKPAVRRVLALVSEVIAFVILVGLTLLMIERLQSALEIGASAMTERWIPVWPGVAMLVASFAIAALAAVVRFVKLITSAPETELEGPGTEGFLE